jgi:hypothetical protein
MHSTILLLYSLALVAFSRAVPQGNPRTSAGEIAAIMDRCMRSEQCRKEMNMPFCALPEGCGGNKSPKGRGGLNPNGISKM